MEAKKSFDRMASEISAAERLEMLKRLESAADPSAQILRTETDDREEQSTLQAKLQTESFLLRLWLFIKSLFSSSDVEYEYNMHLLAKKAKNIENEFPDIINYKKKVLSATFYFHLVELQKAALFFKPSLSLYEENPGNFYAYLGALLAPDFNMKAEDLTGFAEVAPDREPSNELRSSLLRQLDDLLQQIPLSDRNAMYAAVRSAEWLKSFVKLPFEHFMLRFVSIADIPHTCQMDTATQDLAQFAKVLCNGGRIHGEVLEALATFTAVQSKGAQADLREESARILKEMLEQIGRIKLFITSVPLRSVACLVFHSIFWEPESLEGAEDWFVKFKADWKKKFDQQWAVWVKNRKNQQVRERVIRLLSSSSFPVLPYRPWADVPSEVSFAREPVMAFLSAFYEKLYPVYNKSLRILMTEGEFIQRENRMEFTDTYSELNRLAGEIDRFNANLSPQGEQGKLFTKIIRDDIRTIHGKSQIDSLMLALESSCGMISAVFSASCRPLLMILGAITDEVHDVRYSTLQNLSGIQGKQNALFRTQLRAVRHGFMQAAELVRLLEALENE